ncbi:MAG: DUF2079 domain-containing protein, partial [Bacteroidales bacterium]
FFLLRPKYLIMIFPLIAQKVMMSNTYVWGLNGHYSVELMPLIGLAGIDVFSSINVWIVNVKRVILSCSVFLACFSTIYTMHHRSQWFFYENLNFFSKVHYTSSVDVSYVHKALKRYIPKDVSLSASTCLVPHLYQRQYMWSYPIVKTADYIVILDTQGANWPLEQNEVVKNIEDLEKSSEWETILAEKRLYIFKKKSVSKGI